MTSSSTGTSGYTAYGLHAANDISIGAISGTVSATAGSSGAAYGLCSGGAIYGSGGSATAMVISGSVSATAGNAYAIDAQTVNLKVTDSATLSATTNAAAGSAYAIYASGASGGNNVELQSGCKVIGDIYLTGSSNTLTLSSGSGTTNLAGNLAGAQDLSVTGGTWTVSGSVSAVSDLDVSGGVLFYAAAGTMSGNVNVTGGYASFNGVTTGSATVFSGGFLGGTGTFGELTNYGTISPGNSIGTLHVIGNFTNAAGSSLNIQINDAGQSDKIAVGGNATLQGGTVNVLAASGSYTAGTKYTFLTASGGVSGTFAGVTDDLAFLDAKLVYDPNNVEILLQSNNNSYDSQAATPNQHAVAQYLDVQKGGATDDFATVLDNLNTLDGAGARLAFDAMGGEIHSSLATVGIETDDQFLRLIAGRLQSQAMMQGFDEVAASNRLDSNLTYVSRSLSGSPGSSGWTTWAQGYGVGANLASDGNASGLTYSTGGLAVGIERQFGENTKIGLVGGYSDTYATLENRGDNGSIDGGQLAVYLHRNIDESFYVTGIAAYGYNSYNTTRYIDFADIDRTAHANYGGNNFSFYTETGRTIFGQFVHLQPYGALEYIQVYQNSFTETGADSIDVATGGEQAAAFRSLLGTRLFSNFHTDSGMLLTLEGRAAWRHEFLDESRVLDASFAGQTGGTFAIAGVNVDRDAAILGTGLTCHISKAFSVFANYDVVVSQDYTAHVGSGGLQYAW